MNDANLFGYTASILVFCTFYMKQMVPLRVVAIGSNIAFITYAWLAGLTPILLLHSALLPLNLLRLVQERQRRPEAPMTLEEAGQARPKTTNRRDTLTVLRSLGGVLLVGLIASVCVAKAEPPPNANAHLVRPRSVTSFP